MSNEAKRVVTDPTVAAIKAVVNFERDKEYRIGWEDPDTMKKPILVKIRSMETDDLRKALAKVRNMPNDSEGKPNKGRIFFESSILLELKIRSQLETILSKQPEFQKAASTIERAIQKMESQIAEDVKENQAVKVEEEAL